MTLQSQNTLFRQEVIEFQQNGRQWGQIVLLEPASTKVMAWSLTAAIVVGISFLSIAQYARKESVAGYLTPSAGTAKILAPQFGTIRTVHVVEGDIVTEGQPLLTIETAQISAEGQDVNATILATLSQQKHLLGQQIAAEEQRTQSERDRLGSLLAGLETELSHLRAQVATQTERIRLTNSFVTSAARLNSRGYMSEMEYKRRQQEVLEQEQSLAALKQQIAARENQVTETRFTLEQVPTAMAEKIQLLRNELAATEQRMSEINSRRAYTIRAPAAGRVSMLQATVGQTADPRRLQLEILPSNSVLQAELFIPTRAAGFVQVGQEVRLLYEAFPYQKFGTYKGRIIKLSQTILTATDVYGPVALKEPAYKATVALARPDIDADGKKITLQSDMLLTADIVLERRSILGWLLNPLFSAKKVIDFDTLKQSIQNSVIDPLRRAVKEIIQDIIPKVQTSNRNKSYDSNRSKSS